LSFEFFDPPASEWRNEVKWWAKAGEVARVVQLVDNSSDSLFNLSGRSELLNDPRDAFASMTVPKRNGAGYRAVSRQYIANLGDKARKVASNQAIGSP
jgi:hypothetical protein